MRTRTKIAALALLTAGGMLPALSEAQDFHLTQYDAAAQYQNPALTGMYLGEKGDYRIATDYRTQWKSLGIKPFNTIFLSYDMPYTIKEKKFGFGAYVVNNRSGIGHYNTLDFMLSAAYDILKNSNNHYLSTGLQLGLFQKSFDGDAFTYDEQYSQSSGTFDLNQPSYEDQPGKQSIIRFDANFGVFYKYWDADYKAHPFAGFSVYHLNKPNETFTAYTNKLPMRFDISGGCDIDLNDRFTIVPKLLYMNQAKAHEFAAGLVAFYHMKDNNFQPMLGFDYRHQDAIAIEVGLKQDHHIFRVSYDINTSYLKNYTNGRGALEFSLILVGIKGQPLFIPPKSRVE
jgi:type IX secretion system PorP/SprF family membrane protein